MYVYIFTRYHDIASHPKNNSHHHTQPEVSISKIQIGPAQNIIWICNTTFFLIISLTKYLPNPMWTPFIDDLYDSKDFSSFSIIAKNTNLHNS